MLFRAHRVTRTRHFVNFFAGISGAYFWSGRNAQLKKFIEIRELSEVSLMRTYLERLSVSGLREIIIDSCAAAFQRKRPRAIVLEEHGAKSAPDAPIGSVFRKIGYDIFAIRKHLTKLEIAPVRNKTDCISTDYVAIFPE